MKMVQCMDLLIESQDAMSGHNLCNHMFLIPSFHSREIRSLGRSQSGNGKWVSWLWVSSYPWIPDIVKVGGQKRKEQQHWKEHWFESQEICVLVPGLPTNICVILGSQFPFLSINILIYELMCLRSLPFLKFCMVAFLVAFTETYDELDPVANT